MKFRFVIPIIAAACGCIPFARPARAQTESAPAVWTLRRVLQRVAERNPELSITELEIRAAAARVVQARAKPNPEVEATAENMSFPIVGAGLVHYTESTLLISQRLELGGKRDLRVRAAEKSVAVANSEHEVRKVDLISAASHAFVDLLAEQQRVANQAELIRLARRSYEIVGDRVAAGKVSPVEQTRAAVALAAAQIEEDKHRRALAAAKDRIAALWGGVGGEIESVRGEFEIPAPVASVSDSCLRNNPDMKVAAAAVEARDADLALELANRKPDLTFSAGLRRLNLDSEQVWIAGVSLPIPIFDKRQGAIAEARARLDKSRAEANSAEWRLRSALTQARHDQEIARREAATLNETALPAAKEAAAAAEEGYRLGKFEFLNVLDAQRTLAELQGKFIEAVASGMKAAIDIDRLLRCQSPAGAVN